VGDCDGAAGAVVDRHGREVLHQRAAAVDVERLRAEADAEQRLGEALGVLEQEGVNGLAGGVGRVALGDGVLAVAGGGDVGRAAGEQDALTGRGRLRGSSTGVPPASRTASA
jgi:hypothetical protein